MIKFMLFTCHFCEGKEKKKGYKKIAFQYDDLQEFTGHLDMVAKVCRYPNMVVDKLWCQNFITLRHTKVIPFYLFFL
jgi:hypothetical protein